MKKVFVKNLILFQALNLIIKPLWIFMIDLEAQNLLGPDYSDYYVVFNLTVLLNILLDIGIQNFNNAGVAADEQFFKNNFKSISVLKFILGIVYLAIVIPAGIYGGLALNLLLVVAINQVLTSFVLFLRTNINGLHHFTIDGLLSVSDKFFGILICLVFFLSNNVSAMWFAVAQLAATTITLLIAFFYNIKFHRSIPKIIGRVDKFNIQALLKKSIPYALLFTLMGMYTRGDVLMMKWLLKDSNFHCGLYAQSYRLLDAAAMFSMLFAGLLLPMFSRMIGKNEDVKPLTHLATTILLPVAISTALVAWFFGEDILYVMYDVYKKGGIDLLLQGNKVFTNILTCFIPMSLTFIFSTLLTAKGDLRFLNFSAMIALVCNFTINLWLIPKYASYGASISSLSTQSLFALLCIIRCFHLFGFKVNLKDVIRFVAYTISLFGVFFLIKGIGNLWIELLVFGASSVLLSFLIGIFNFNQILQIFDKRRQ